MHSRKLLAALVGAAILIAAALGVWASSPAGAAAAPDTSPLTAARFELTIDGHSLAVFSELVGIVSGRRIGIGARARDEGRGHRPQAPRQADAPTITLRRAMTRNIEMAAWHELVILGDLAAATKSVSITAYNKRGDPIARYHLTNAWPSKVEITAEDSAAGGVMSETVTFVSQFMQRVSV